MGRVLAHHPLPPHLILCKDGENKDGEMMELAAVKRERREDKEEKDKGFDEEEWAKALHGYSDGLKAEMRAEFEERLKQLEVDVMVIANHLGFFRYFATGQLVHKDDPTPATKEDFDKLIEEIKKLGREIRNEA